MVLLSLTVAEGWKVVGEVNGPLVLAGLVLALLLFGIRYFQAGFRGAPFEVDEAELGLGDQKFKLRPNYLDRQVAYKIWVELSTRKIGLPIDLENDVVAEIYDSWHSFFQVTRELIKDIPVSRVRDASTQRIIQLSVDVLNNGLRPHLTRWQARFRRWYDKQIARDDTLELHPQDIQAKFASFDELAKDLVSVNLRLISYRTKMRELVLGPAAPLSALSGLDPETSADV